MRASFPSADGSRHRISGTSMLSKRFVRRHNVGVDRPLSPRRPRAPSRGSEACRRTNAIRQFETRLRGRAPTRLRDARETRRAAWAGLVGRDPVRLKCRTRATGFGEVRPDVSMDRNGRPNRRVTAAPGAFRSPVGFWHPKSDDRPEASRAAFGPRSFRGDPGAPGAALVYP